MSPIKPSFGRVLMQHRGPLLAVLLLAPLAMAPKGCSSGVVGDDCPANMTCTGDAGSANAGSGSGGGSPLVTCGGLRGASCSADEYCAYPSTAACGAADQTGTCQKKPQVCNEVFAPVCGCDAKTYANECAAAAAGVSVAQTGVCPDASPGKECGAFLAGTCGAGYFCDFPQGMQCGAGDQIGACTAVPTACTTIYAPVCGCDGITYGNACVAAQASVSVAATGACDTTPGADCGGLTGACTAGQYCNFPAGCGIADGAGKCALIPGACDAIYAPVCGCDGKTYGNDCVAATARVSVKSQGVCP